MLYDPCQMEVPDHCVRSVIDIRNASPRNWASWKVVPAWPRASGRCVQPAGSSWSVWARMAAKFKLDVEDKLAAILPANAEADTGDDDRLFRRLYP